MRAAILEKTAGGTEEGVNGQTQGTLSQGQKCVNYVYDIWFGLNRA